MINNSNPETIRDQLVDLYSKTIAGHVAEIYGVYKDRLPLKGQSMRKIDADPSVIAVRGHVTGYLLGLQAAIDFIDGKEVSSIAPDAPEY